MENTGITSNKLQFFLTECRNFSRNQRQDYLDDILANEGIFAFIAAEEKLDRERVIVNESRQFIIEKIAYLLLAIGTILTFMSLFIPAGIILVLSFIAIFHAKYWFKNRLESLNFTYHLHRLFNKDLNLLAEVRQEIIEERKLKNDTL
jgi:hypothetical protein